MKTIKLKLTTVFLLAMAIAGNTALASDLDDGISTYTADSIQADSELGNPSVNLSFIILDAISSAKRMKDQENVNINDGSGINNENSVVCEAGADCSGPIYNINLNDN